MSCHYALNPKDYAWEHFACKQKKQKTTNLWCHFIYSSLGFKTQDITEGWFLFWFPLPPFWDICKTLSDATDMNPRLVEKTPSCPKTAIKMNNRRTKAIRKHGKHFFWLPEPQARWQLIKLSDKRTWPSDGEEDGRNNMSVQLHIYDVIPKCCRQAVASSKRLWSVSVKSS